jgi:hypothetical protein
MDEAGDTGWSLNHPYGKGGSSRFLILAAISIPSGKNKLIERIVRHLYRSRKGRKLSNELKSTELNGHEKMNFAKKLIDVKQKNPDINLMAVVAEKGNVNTALRTKCESFYTHMAEQMLHTELARKTVVDFFPDARAMKPKDKHALPNYLETQLAISGHIPTITTTPSESGRLLEIQCADIICSILFSHYEFNQSTQYKILEPAIAVTKLF